LGKRKRNEEGNHEEEPVEPNSKVVVRGDSPMATPAD